MKKVLKKLYSKLYCLINRNNGLFSNSNQISFSETYLYHCKFEITGKNNKVIIGRNTKLRNCKIVILGDNCVINIVGGQGSRLCNMTLWCEDNCSKIEIGKNIWMEGGQIASTEGCNIIIGDDFLSAHDLEIRNGDSHSIYDVTNGCRTNKAQDVVVGEHVWVAARVTILKGSFIPARSIVATGAVITQAFNKTNSIYGGVPAKMIKSNIYWTPERY